MMKPNYPAGKRISIRPVPLLLAVLVLAAVCLLVAWGCAPHRIIVALDAGHGGDDPGAVGLVQESELTEGVAQELFRLLENDGRITPVLCRTAGEGASVNDRSRAAQKAGATLLLSLHGNYAEDSSASGFECYPALPGRRTHDDSLRFANLLCAEMENSGVSLRGDSGIRYVCYDLSGNKVFLEGTPHTTLPSFGVLENSGCPAVLAELGFVSNPEDAARLSPAGYSGTALHCYRAICAYYGMEPLADIEQASF